MLSKQRTGRLFFQYGLFGISRGPPGWLDTLFPFTNSKKKKKDTPIFEVCLKKKCEGEVFLKNKCQGEVFFKKKCEGEVFFKKKREGEV